MTGVLTYPLAACLMLVAGVLLLIRRGQSEPARHAAVAAVVSAAWAALMAFQAHHEVAGMAGAGSPADGLRIAAWFIALESLSTVAYPRWLRRTALTTSRRDGGVRRGRLGVTIHAGGDRPCSC